MKLLQKVKIKSENGKQSEELIGGAKPIVDSVADNLVIDGEQAIKKLPKKGIASITVYREAKDAEVKARNEAKGIKDPEAEAAKKKAADEKLAEQKKKEEAEAAKKKAADAKK